MMQRSNSLKEEINFHAEEIDFKIDNEQLITHWICKTASSENQAISTLNIIFCTDKYLHKMNMEYLQHDTLTDVITFQYHENKSEPIEGDIFISIERTNENAQQFGVTPLQELYRVIIHGCLHLLGYNDKSDEEQIIMTQKENEYLQILHESKQFKK